MEGSEKACKNSPYRVCVREEFLWLHVRLISRKISMVLIHPFSSSQVAQLAFYLADRSSLFFSTLQKDSL